MKILVAYMSSTGNTKKVAEAIFGEINGEKELKRMKTYRISGSMISRSLVSRRISSVQTRTKEFLQKQCTGGRKVALFVTHCAPEDVAEVPGMDG